MLHQRPAGIGPGVSSYAAPNFKLCSAAPCSPTPKRPIRSTAGMMAAPAPLCLYVEPSCFSPIYSIVFHLSRPFCFCVYSLSALCLLSVCSLSAFCLFSVCSLSALFLVCIDLLSTHPRIPTPHTHTFGVQAFTFQGTTTTKA